jgi:hypothetical protein
LYSYLLHYAGAMCLDRAKCDAEFVADLLLGGPCQRLHPRRRVVRRPQRFWQKIDRPAFHRRDPYSYIAVPADKDDLLPPTFLCELHVGRAARDGSCFQIEVVRDARNASQRPVGEGAQHYRACFCSYSSLDRVEMLKRAQGLRATGLKTFVDVLDLRPGDIWDPRIFAAIDEAIFSW